MDQSRTGAFIAQRRRLMNLTQEQLSERLGVSNKTVSKWETGKSMPDYSVVKPLCRELGITIGELMDGETMEKSDKYESFDEKRYVDLLSQIQRLQWEKKIMYAILLFVMGMAMLTLSNITGGSAVRDFLSGVMLGISVPVMIIAIVLAGWLWHKGP